MLIIGELTLDLGEYLRFVLLSEDYKLLDVAFFSDAGPFGETDAELTYQAAADEELDFVFGGKRYRLRVLETPSKWRQEWLSLRVFREDEWKAKPRYLWFSRVRSWGWKGR